MAKFKISIQQVSIYEIEIEAETADKALQSDWQERNWRYIEQTDPEVLSIDEIKEDQNVIRN